MAILVLTAILALDPWIFAHLGGLDFVTALQSKASWSELSPTMHLVGLFVVALSGCRFGPDSLPTLM